MRITVAMYVSNWGILLGNTVINVREKIQCFITYNQNENYYNIVI